MDVQPKNGHETIIDSRSLDHEDNPRIYSKNSDPQPLSPIGPIKIGFMIPPRDPVGPMGPVGPVGSSHYTITVDPVGSYLPVDRCNR